MPKYFQNFTKYFLNKPSQKCQNFIFPPKSDHTGFDGNILKRYPASYSHVMAIGATTQNDNKASFSSYGSHISLSAPGIAIPTTARNNAYKN